MRLDRGQAHPPEDEPLRRAPQRVRVRAELARAVRPRLDRARARLAPAVLGIVVGVLRAGRELHLRAFLEVAHELRRLLDVGAQALFACVAGADLTQVAE